MNKKLKNGSLSNSEAEKIRSKYSKLIQNIIEANIGFPEEIKDCVVNHIIVEEMMLYDGYMILIHEFGMELSEFPIDFQNACTTLHEEFQKDFPYASVLDITKKNKEYGMNYRSPDHLVYFLAEYDDIRKIIRAELLKLVNEYHNKYNVGYKILPYKVTAKNLFSENCFRLELKIHKRQINNFPCILISEEYAEPLSEINLIRIEKSYELLSKLQKWRNEINYTWICGSNVELLDLIPEFNNKPNDCHFSFFKITSIPDRYTKLIWSDEVDMTNINTDFGCLYE